MKALVKRHAHMGLWLEDVPVPRIDINDVLIEVTRTLRYEWKPSR